MSEADAEFMLKQLRLIMAERRITFEKACDEYIRRRHQGLGTPLS